MDRVILHSDLNNFYASVECLYRPEIRDKPVAVGGDQEARHGIILAKNYLAKATGIQTGEVIWQAKRKCPALVIVPPNYPLYMRYSHLARDIYADYTDQIEPFGLDEAWLDVTGSCPLFGTGTHIADEIRERIKAEMGVTASVGVSYNKIFAKLGSDLKKPDATTVITPENYKHVVWPLPAGDLLYVGRSTNKKLASCGIIGIGDIAKASPAYLRLRLGKWGEVLWSFANGYDSSPVARAGEESVIKSIGNSITTPRDLETEEDVRMILYILSESVAARLRDHGFKCRTVHIHIRDKDLFTFGAQGKLAQPSAISSEIAEKALAIFQANYTWEKPIRSIGVRGGDLVTAASNIQISLFDDENRRIKQENLEVTLDSLRSRFGHHSVQRAILLQDNDLMSINPKDDHVIHPIAYFKEGRLP
ncbi:MAG: DNA polymerase IV [Syntrophomonadaceae bacterium]|nr:DNA polymerase IV [Syntrophomonadaceae bacterium]